MKKFRILRKVLAERWESGDWNELIEVSESFFLFSQPIPSRNLGFIDPKAKSLEILVAGRDLTIQQSPTILSSNRKEGTTGAGGLPPLVECYVEILGWRPTVLWKITPLFADWIASEDNVLFRTSSIGTSTTALELGCGISGIVSLAVSPKIRTYIATDQEYVFKTLKLNIAENTTKQRSAKSKKQRWGKSTAHSLPTALSNIKIAALDWESTLISTIPNLLGLESSNLSGDIDIDIVLASDCVFNEALIDPFVQTCVDLCSLPKAKLPKSPTICVIAQQLRSHMVFEAWLLAFHRSFRVWRVPDQLLLEGLKEDSGFVIHIGFLRESRIESWWTYERAATIASYTAETCLERSCTSRNSLLYSLCLGSSTFILLKSRIRSHVMLWYNARLHHEKHELSITSEL